MLRFDASRVMRVTFLLYILANTWADVTYYQNDEYKYVILFLNVALGLLIFLMNQNPLKKPLDFSVAGRIGLVVVVFVFVSIIAMLFNGMKIYFAKDILYMVMPAAYCFVLVNVDTDPNKDYYFILLFIGQTISFLNVNFYALFNINNYLAISFTKSYSPFEYQSSQTLTAAFIYFYARKRRVLAGLAFVLTFLAFKRLNVVFVFAVVLFGWAVRKIKVSTALLTLTKIVFILSPLLLDFLLSPTFTNWFDATFDMTFARFTMGRFTQIMYVMNYEGVLLGRGAVNNMLASTGFAISTLHADLLRIYIETTIVGLAVFVNAYWNLLKRYRNIYCYAYMLLMFVTMFASVSLHGVPNSLAMFLMCSTNFDLLENRDHALPRAHRRISLVRITHP